MPDLAHERQPGERRARLAAERALTDGQPGPDGVLTSVEYGDCGRFAARQCPDPVEIRSTSVCHAFLQPTVLLEARGTRSRRARGTVFADRLGVDEGVELFSGRIAASVTIFGAGTTRRYRRLLGALVRIGIRDRRGGGLPLVRLPAPQARGLRAALVTRPRHATLRRAARALSLSPSLLRKRLRLARALRSSGGIRSTRCG